MCEKDIQLDTDPIISFNEREEASEKYHSALSKAYEIDKARKVEERLQENILFQALSVFD